MPAAPSHGLCRSAGGLPSQSPSGDSSPEGRAKSRLPLWGRWTRVSEDGEGKVPAAPSHGLCGSAGGLPSQSRLPPCQRLGCRLGRPLGNVPPGRSGPRRGSQVSPPPLGGGGLALARTERARCQRLPRMGCVEALAGCPLSHGWRRASSPKGGAKSRLPPLGEVSCLWHDREGSVKPPSRHSAVREKRFAVSLVSFQADAH